MFKKRRFDKGGLRRAIESVVGGENLFTDEAELLMYSYDAGMARARPEAVIRFTSTEQVAPVVRTLYAEGIPFLPRLAGTNLSGGTIPLKGGAILNLSLLNRIRQIDTARRIALVEPGVVNMRLQQELDRFGFFYAPDPASQKVSTIGGNIGENAGGPQCLKYGVTSDNVEQLEVVTPEGDVRIWGYRDPGPDLMSLLIGSEGTLGIVTRAWLKIMEKPRFVKTAVAAFPSIENAIEAVTKIIGAGIVPRALEAMDKVSLNAALRGAAGSAAKKTHYPPGTEAILLIDVDGAGDKKTAAELREIASICKSSFALAVSTAEDQAERDALWQARKGAYPAMARLAPNVMVEDGVVPRPMLPAALRETREILSKYKLNAGLIFHAGDGNLHPNVIFDERDLQEVKRVKKAGYEILRSCIRLGGSISGEHGIGVEKRVAMNWMYDSAALDLFGAIKTAFDPKNLANPDKIFPVAEDRRAGPPSLKPGLLGEAASALLNELKLRGERGEKSAVMGRGSRGAAAPGAKRQYKTLDTTPLNRILELDQANFTVRAEAGVPVRELRKWLRKAGLSAALPDMEGTLGGLIASKAWPPARDILLGMDVAMADGSMLSFGGKTVKNVAGYDVMKLFCGSMGAYGIILTLTLRTAFEAGRERPEPAQAAAAAGDFRPDEYHKRLKKAFDPRNLLNPWIYGENGA